MAGIVFVTKSVPGHESGDSDFYEPRIRYRVVVGQPEKQLGVCMGEFRAMRINKHYVLEGTRDSDMCNAELSYDVRRFSRVPGLSVFDGREEADRELEAEAKQYAIWIGERMGLEVQDRVEK